MTTITERPQRDTTTTEVPAHPHYVLGTTMIAALLVGFTAVAIGIIALIIQAGHESVDSETVSALVDQQLSSVALPSDASATPPSDGTSQPDATPSVTSAGFGSVIPELTPKTDLPVANAVAVSYAPEVPARDVRSTQAIVEVEFDIVEEVTVIDPDSGVEFETWGFRIAGDDQTFASGTPGPMVRARVGDVLRFTINNPDSNLRAHNVDFHAVTGQGGGAEDTLVAPGESTVIEARMLYPGMFMYHCAAGDVPAHIARGMYGGILVDPADPLPEADKEFYVVQSEYYLTGDGPLVDLDRVSMSDENPSMVVFNGAKGALTGDNALQIDVGDRARFYFVNAGLNLTSNFHPIGSHWDAVWPEGALLSQPIRGSQTTLVPAGGAVVADLLGQVPSNILLVDHALTRTFDKGALGIVTVSGEPNREIFEGAPSAEPEVGEPAPTGETVEMLAGSWTFQEQPASDEFAVEESIPDYSVNELRITVGTTVTWVNKDDQQHTATAVDGSFDSGFIGQDETFSFTFDTPGEYEYLCTPHPWMRARIIVEG